MRLFVRIAANGGSGLTGLVPLVDNDVLPSVSRRHPGRRNAQVWTSGNRIFRIDNPQLLLEAALLHTGEAESSSLQPGLWGKLSHREALDRTAWQLAELAELEAAEERGSAWAVPERGAIWKSNSTSYWTSSPAIAFG
jgi:hypothetical protein